MSNSSSNDEYKDIILKHLKRCNPFCSFAFKRKWLKAEPSRKYSTYAFKCQGKCTFMECPIEFAANIPSFQSQKKPSTVTLIIQFSTNLVKHSYRERRARQIRGKARKNLMKQLQFKSPATVYHEKFTTLSPSELQSGNRDKVSKGSYVIQKISSEGNLAEQPHFDLLSSLRILYESLRENHPGKIPGYLQRVNMIPFSVMAYTEEGVRLYHNMAKKEPLFLDATGTIVSLRKCNYDGVTILLYSLVIRHPVKKCPPVAVAEYISTEHSVLAISNFLSTFRRSEYIIYGNDLTKPKHIVIDRSIVLLLSILKVYFKEDLSEYLSRCFRLIFQCPNKGDAEKGFVHACIAHVMKSFKFDLKSLG